MKKRNKLAVLVAVVCLMFSSLALADAKQDFNRGMELFRAGDYAGAVARFESARKQGIKTVSLYYNLGSAYYKLGEYPKARYYFDQVRKSPRMRDLAEYNLGLIALKTGNRSVARDYFSSVMAISKDKKLRAMSAKQIASLDMLAKPWLAYLSANLGYDDNITASPSDAVQDVSDSFYDIFVSADTVIQGQREQGWLIDASYFRIDFMDNDLYDDSQLGVGIRNQRDVGDWALKTHVSFSQRDYADEDFQSIVKFDLLGKTSLSRAERLYLRYIYEDINSDNTLYDYLQGWRQRARIEYRNYQRLSNSQLYYELELNDRQDINVTGYSASYSPTRHGVHGKYTHIIDARWSLTGDVSYRFSDYPATITQSRQDDRWRFAIEADYRLDKKTRLRTKLQHISNESTLDIYDYDKSVLTVGLTRLF